MSPFLALLFICFQRFLFHLEPGAHQEPIIGPAGQTAPFSLHAPFAFVIRPMDALRRRSGRLAVPESPDSNGLELSCPVELSPRMTSK